MPDEGKLVEISVVDGMLVRCKPDRRMDLPGLSRRRFREAHLRKLAAPEFYDYVRRQYPRGLTRRVAGFLATMAEKVMP
ncbi:MAG TPA: hypothetical protein VKE40_09855 [Gemmataceae bacterium]|nr:hypothetical protein [Gemmataceae bacterium]